MHNFDSYFSEIESITGVGSRDVGFYYADRQLGQEELAAVYEQDAIARRIVDRVVDDSIRAEWDLVGLDSAYDWRGVKSEVDDLCALLHIGDAWRWARLQGGAILVIAANDEQTPEMPLNLATVQAVRGLSALDRTQIMPEGSDFSRGSESLRNPPYYTINDAADAAFAKVHSSRVIRFDGMRVPTSRLAQNNGWGPSVLHGCWKSLVGYRQCLDQLLATLKRINVMVIKIQDWKQTKMASAAEAQKLTDGLREMWRAMTALNLLAIDTGDSFEEIKRSVEGIPSMLSAQLDALVADSDTTRQIITGTQTSTGLNSDTKGEWRAWYDRVTVERRVVVEPALNRILEIVFACRRNRGEKVPEKWTIEWKPLEREAEGDRAERMTKWASAFASLPPGVMTPAEMRQTLIDADLLDRTELAAATQAPAPPVPAPEIAP
jgi:uncharacterized protein